MKDIDLKEFTNRMGKAPIEPGKIHANDQVRLAFNGELLELFENFFEP